ncbi:MAG: ABC transporter ATP-binding protein [Chitinophagales bacterium]|nr:ABC transporter ATP-binding protein [Chitinophagales bacterium]
MSKHEHTTQSMDLHLLWKVIKLAFPFKFLLITTIMYSLALAILGPLRPELIQRLIDENILNNGSNTQLLVILIIVTLMTESILRYFFIFSSNKLGQSVVKNLRTAVFKQVLSLNLRYFDKTPIGTTTTRTVNDIETINSIFTQGFIQLLADILTLLVIVVWMFLKSWQLAFISLAALPFMILSTYIFKESVKKAFQKVRTQVSLLNAFLQEHISGMRLVQIFGAENQEFQKFEAINKKHKDANVEAIWAYSIFFPVVEILLAVAIGLMVWLGAGLLIKNKLTTSYGTPADVGLIVQFILLIGLLFRPIRFMAERFNTMQMGLVAARRVFQLLNRKDYIPNQGKQKIENLTGEIEFKNLNFAYNSRDYVLNDISFHLPAGKTLAIVGHTGSGKSSIINLISRLYDWQEGDILLDGIPIKEYDLNFYRKQISTVLQDVFLFSGSILDNIRLLDQGISDEEIKHAAKLIGANEFIEKLPNQYNYQVMERGATLSLGQRQLISFVRALVFRPKILILDEATSSVDSETEFIVQKAINKLVQNRTSIIIAHRLATISKADYVMMLEGGKIADYGQRETLLSQSGPFKKFYNSYSKENE